MNEKRTGRREGSPKVGNGRISPDFRAWEDIQEVKELTFALVLRALGRGTIPELGVILAMIGLFYLGRDLIATIGGGLPSARVLACVVAVALMISALAVYLHRMATRSRNDAENSEGAEGSPQPGNERSGPHSARKPPRADGRR